MESRYSHSRYNPLLDLWVLVSPNRIKRPWSGETQQQQQKGASSDFRIDHSLCPGSIRASGVKNPDYKDVFVFDNDFPAFNCPHELDDTKTDDDSDLFRIRMESGQCKVCCYHPDETMTIPKMSDQNVQKVVRTWKQVYEAMSNTGNFGWIQIFENRGAMMGCSNPSPHCQIWATKHIPSQIVVKHKTQQNYHEKHRSPMLHDYVGAELEKNERIVAENEDWVCLVPFWADWPYETMILPKTKLRSITELDETRIVSFAQMLKTLVTKYDNLFKTIFPYSMGVFGLPAAESHPENDESWLMHVSFNPPLLRSATIRKYMVGYEMFAQAQRDITTEKAAKQLREIDGTKLVE